MGLWIGTNILLRTEGVLAGSQAASIRNPLKSRA